jgi:hypothetical protein
MDLDRYIDGWKSVKNQYWDLETEEGKKLFENIMTDIKKEFQEEGVMEMVYNTKVWIAKKQNV